MIILSLKSIVADFNCGQHNACMRDRIENIAASKGNFQIFTRRTKRGLQEDAVPLLFIARDPSEGSVYKGGGSLFEGETLESYSLNNSGPVAAKKTHITKRNNKQRFT